MSVYTIVFAASTLKVLKKWKKSSPQLYKKASIIINELSENPRVGLGHPEPLVGGDGVTWSRRISGNERVIYDIHDEIVEVYILQLGGHYRDK
ncbi:MAG: Txe/YoeB family addiction module toxin [Paludibacteraceae bacterium]|nr:Txe/YoeB family addiction module toxin [Paludibacteraceae bacterium]